MIAYKHDQFPVHAKCDGIVLQFWIYVKHIFISLQLVSSLLGTQKSSSFLFRWADSHPLQAGCWLADYEGVAIQDEEKPVPRSLAAAFGEQQDLLAVQHSSPVLLMQHSLFQYSSACLACAWIDFNWERTSYTLIICNLTLLLHALREGQDCTLVIMF